MRAEQDRPHRALLRTFVGRPLLFVFWSLVLWGSFLALAWLYALATRGGDAMGLVGEGPWAWLNGASILLAAAAWGAFAVSRRRRQ